MKLPFRTAVAAATLTLLLTAARSAETEPGFVDVGSLLPASKGQYVEVNLSPAMLKFAAKLTAHQEPETAELIGNLHRIRVNVVGMDDTNRAGNIEKIEAIRRTLNAQGWTQVVSVREQPAGDNVDVHVKQKSDDVIEGVVVTVIDDQGQAVVVNIVGNIRADQISKVAEKFDIEPLKRIQARTAPKPADKSV